MGCEDPRYSARGELVSPEVREGIQTRQQYLQKGRFWQIGFSRFCDSCARRILCFFDGWCRPPRDAFLFFYKDMARIKELWVPAIFSIFPIFCGGHCFAIFRFLEELIFEILRHKTGFELRLIPPHQRVRAVFEQAPFQHKFLRLCALGINGKEAHRFVIRSPDPVACLPRQFAQVPPQRFAIGNCFCCRDLYQLLSELQDVHVG
ncbi:putative membrane protein [Donghicola eburneus]|uniref:Putative membrane protein n=2 Tax=Donghicola eburneus TaxID=393278 RepID=A0A1M4MZT7_9RHOB|nr:putative membrane protein [Donghicola eburneus]